MNNVEHTSPCKLSSQTSTPFFYTSTTTVISRKTTIFGIKITQKSNEKNQKFTERFKRYELTNSTRTTIHTPIFLTANIYKYILRNLQSKATEWLAPADMRSTLRIGPVTVTASLPLLLLLIMICPSLAMLCVCVLDFVGGVGKVESETERDIC